MKIIDILTESAELLGLHYDLPQLNEMTPENENDTLTSNENIASLFNLIKFSMRELCTNYIPIEAQQTVTSTNKSYPIAELNNFIRVKNILKNEQPIKFKILSRNIIFEEDGEYIVNYVTYPDISSVFDEIDFLQEFSPDAIVFGLCSYYSLAHGMFEEFESFHEKYIERAESLKNLKIFTLPTRSWK